MIALQRGSIEAGREGDMDCNDGKDIVEEAKGGSRTMKSINDIVIYLRETKREKEESKHLYQKYIEGLDKEITQIQAMIDAAVDREET